MSGIKYYQLSKDEELPDEFCAVKDIGGEPSEYTFYVPEAENAKLQASNEVIAEDHAALCEQNAKLRKLARDYLIFYSQPGCTYCFCYDECHESEEPCIAFERLVDRTNELGIEVPR